MTLPSAFPRLKEFRFPRDIVAYAVVALLLKGFFLDFCG